MNLNDTLSKALSVARYLATNKEYYLAVLPRLVD